MVEEWRDIPGYEGEFQASNLGKIRSLDRYVKVCVKNDKKKGSYSRMQFCPGKELAQLDIRGYKHVHIRSRKGKSGSLFVHRLVAQTFIPNPNAYSQVNHKDEDKFNNRVDNLEWCSPGYNTNYGTRNKRVSDKLKNYPKFSKPVVQMNLDGKVIATYASAAEAARVNGFRKSGINNCRAGRIKTSMGYKWGYQNQSGATPSKA